ncbi:helicase-related protein [Mesonia sp. K4-1]|uniref:helicase-related protein n=1 Tax=Mesonia sp. K4-1 TaxID=2602760 RepID=UPI0011C8F7F0|nr:helicase-related protein [Mesonia sp. K4-1]TXK76885.1 DEAD/DEAH box helicase [Mesonia sp. K4-1]
MAELIEISQLIKLIETEESFGNREFDIAKSISYYYNKRNIQANDLILFALNFKYKFKFTSGIINDLARELGLFPYLNPEELSLEDLIAYEFHRPEGKKIENIVFHKIQAQIYYSLLNGENVILSAPTSFGKSLVIDAVIAIEKYENIVIVVPTIALIDETRKRLSKFKESYKVITHSSQTISEKNIFVLTQERVLEIVPDDIDIDFFVIDEFYKINFTTSDLNRTIALNQAFYKLLKKGAQFYLLGPNIENINNSYFPNEVTYKYIRTDYKTVINRRIKVDYNGNHIDKLIELCSELDGQTLIYCKSPRSINQLAKALFLGGIFKKNKSVEKLSNWIRSEFHSEWYLADYLEFGIGLHHGRLPRSLSQIILDKFNNDELNVLLCTSTIIEGVNTKAKNVIIYDNKVAQNKFDFFTYNNICGRSGRMFEHFIGDVYLFHDAPIEELPLVDFPLFTQGENTPDRLLLQLNEEDLNKKSKRIVNEIKSNSELSFETLKSNSNIEPSFQNDLAKVILDYEQNIRWHYPDYKQLEAVCFLIWEHFIAPSNSRAFIKSYKQLTFKIYQVMRYKDIKTLLALEVANKTNKDEINKAIEAEINFIKYWPQYHFPIYLKNLQSIANEVFENNNKEPIDYSYFASQLESLFTNSNYNILEEYGLPIQVSKKIQGALENTENLDDLLEIISKLNIENLALTEFEKEILLNMKEYI